MQVVLGKEKRKDKVSFVATCNAVKIPVNVVDYSTDEKKDKAYEGRVRVVEAFVGLPVFLYQRRKSYIDRETNERKFSTSYYAACGTDFIAIEVAYLPEGEKKEDPNYGSHRRILSAFAEVLQPKDEAVNVAAAESESSSEEAPTGTTKPTLQSMDDNSDIPF